MATKDEELDRIGKLETSIINRIVEDLRENLDWGDFLEVAGTVIDLDDPELVELGKLLMQVYGV